MKLLLFVPIIFVRNSLNGYIRTDIHPVNQMDRFSVTKYTYVVPNRCRWNYVNASVSTKAVSV